MLTIFNTCINTTLDFSTVSPHLLTLQPNGKNMYFVWIADLWPESSHWWRFSEQWEDVRAVWADPQTAAETLHWVDAASVSEQKKRKKKKLFLFTVKRHNLIWTLCSFSLKGFLAGISCHSARARECLCWTSTCNSFLRDHAREWVPLVPWLVSLSVPLLSSCSLTCNLARSAEWICVQLVPGWPRQSQRKCDRWVLKNVKGKNG